MNKKLGEISRWAFIFHGAKQKQAFYWQYPVPNKCVGRYNNVVNGKYFWGEILDTLERLNLEI